MSYVLLSDLDAAGLGQATAAGGAGGASIEEIVNAIAANSTISNPAIVNRPAECGDPNVKCMLRPSPGSCDPKTQIRVFAPGVGFANCLPKSSERVAHETEIARLSKRYQDLSIQEMNVSGQLTQLCKASGGNYYDWGNWTNASTPTPTRPRCTFTYPASTGRAPDFKWGLDAGLAPPPQAQALLDQLSAIKAEQKQINRRQDELNKPYEGGPCWPPVDCSGPAVSRSCGMRIGEAPNTIQNGQCVPNVEILKRQQAAAPTSVARPVTSSSTTTPAVVAAGVVAFTLLGLGLWRWSQAESA